METNEGRTQNNNLNEEGLQKRYKELSVKWAGGDALVMWLCLNQITFEIISYDPLLEEQKALKVMEL